MKYKAAIFDMDGTILNTLEDLWGATNYMLRVSGYPERTLDEVRQFVGNGIRKLIERAAPQDTDSAEIDRLFGVFNGYYKEHCADNTTPYDGILDMLKKLRAGGVKTAVVSNKADYAVQELCVQYFDGLFDAAAGERAGVRKKPAPDAVFAVLDKLGVAAADAVYIGDSDVDVETARNSGMAHIIVDWGFRDKGFLIAKGAKLIVSSPHDIENIILQ